jgi:hypothetical protein
MKKYELEVHGKNELKRIALAEIKNILPQLVQYLNKRIDTQTGLSKKFVINFSKPKPEPLKDGFGMLQCSFLTVNYETLILRLSFCLNGGSYEDRTYYCQYFDRTFEIAKVENFNLTEIFNIDNIIKSYGLNDIIDLEEEEKKIAKCKELQEELDKVKYSIKIQM